MYPIQVRTRPRKWWLLIVGAIALAALLYLSPAWTFGRRYDRLALEMSVTTVEDLFGRPADYVCKYRAATVAYYKRGGYADDRADVTKLPREVTRKTEIPYLYGSGQFLFDARGRLAAYTINGEADRIVTREGSFPGSHLQQLDDAVLDRMVVP